MYKPAGNAHISQMAQIIAVDRLSYSYPRTSTPAVREVSFHVDAGEIFGLLGPNGAGKSTTQKILIGILSGYSGAVQVFGRARGSWGRDFYERVGVSFEIPNHYGKLSALENLRYFAALYSGEKEDPMSALAAVGLEEAANKRVGAFSKGMKSRLTIARALLNKPELLFLDEPTSGLDPVTSRQVRDLIRDVRDGGATVFLTTHSMAIADELCDRVGFIVDGRLPVIDKPRSLRLRHGRRSVRLEYRENGALVGREFPLDGIGGDAEFLSLLRSRDVETIHTLETTLEDVFIEVTGRALR